MHMRNPLITYHMGFIVPIRGRVIIVTMQKAFGYKL
jgi:hypothetical protein